MYVTPLHRGFGKPRKDTTPANTHPWGRLIWTEMGGVFIGGGWVFKGGSSNALSLSEGLFWLCLLTHLRILTRERGNLQEPASRHSLVSSPNRRAHRQMADTLPFAGTGSDRSCFTRCARMERCRMVAYGQCCQAQEEPKGQDEYQGLHSMDGQNPLCSSWVKDALGDGKHPTVGKLWGTSKQPSSKAKWHSMGTRISHWAYVRTVKGK